MVLEQADVRAMVRLVGEVAAVEGDIVAKKHFLMGGLCELIGASSWAWALVCSFAPGEVPAYVGHLHGGFTEAEFAKFLQACEHPDMGRLNGALTREFEATSRHLTRLRQQLDPEGFFYRSESFPLWTEAGVDAVIMSVRPLPRGGQSMIGTYRRPREPLFTEREARIAHIVLSEIGWLHELGLPQDRGTGVPDLSPRRRVTLYLLLEGQSRKQIADHMEISVHTVGDYIKEVYRHFGVRSQAELMRRFLQGDGGDMG